MSGTEASGRRRLRTPVSTYRLQLHPGFTFADAAAIAPYLSSLGITDCYTSPISTPRPGSTHGYDVSNHNEVNPELGGQTGYERLSDALSSLDMGHLLDFVPNHMGNDPRTNEWWRDVLENGPGSRFARFFDIDWTPVKPELKDRLLLPILGEQYGEALEGGALELRFKDGGLVVTCGNHELPIDPRQAPRVYEHDLDRLVASLGEDDADAREFLSILSALRNLPPYTERDTRLAAERHREQEVARQRLAALASSAPAIRDHITAATRTFNGVAGDASSFDRLHALLELQVYRLASWRTASDEVNYRRFFDINELVGLRVEDPEVFDRIHELLFRLVGAGHVTGVRLDHIDGLADPTAYLQRLRDALGAATGQPTASGPFYVVVEKILSAGESLRERWAAAGTTGYTFLNDVNGVFVDPRGARRMWRAYVRLTGRAKPFDGVLYDSRHLIINTAMTSEFQVLVSAANRLSEEDRRSRDFTLGSIRRALREILACFPVYRTYLADEPVDSADREVVDAAVAAARERNPAMESSVFDFLQALILPEAPVNRFEAMDVRYRRRLAVAVRAQQYTAPLQAKGMEDTALYRYNVLLSLNEVGGDPRRFGRTVDAFHEANAERRRLWPAEMIATATHDTKRGEDARARLNVLSEIPAEWQNVVSLWMRTNRKCRTRVGGDAASLAPGAPGAPGANDEYHLYQALLAIWPPEAADAPVPDRAPLDVAERLSGYMLKAIREAKLHTSWVSVNVPYEQAVATFIDRALRGDGARRFLPVFVPFARRLARLGMVNSLAQLVLKIVSPGVPDFYQGTELWDLSLVDPDNRRPVDYALRQRMLAEVSPPLDPPSGTGEGLAARFGALLQSWPDGRVKLLATALGLRLRRAEPALFLGGEYLPLGADGARAAHVVACARRLERRVVVAIVPRLVASLERTTATPPVESDMWATTTVRWPDDRPPRRLRNIFTGETFAATMDGSAWRIRVGDALATSPVALLQAETPIP